MPPTTFDSGALLERVDNDLAFLAETVEMLASDGRALLADVRGAIDSGDAAAVGRAAHALKGMISNFCAPMVQESALALEKLGKSGDLSGAGEAMRELGERVESLIAELEQFVKGRV